MDPVWKKNPRGQFERKLNLAEKEALLHVFTNGRKPAQADLRIANKILEEMDRQELWIKCDCVDSNLEVEGPFNCEVNAIKLRHVKSTRPHDELCPLYRLKKIKTRTLQSARANQSAQSGRRRRLVTRTRKREADHTAGRSGDST